MQCCYTPGVPNSLWCAMLIYSGRSKLSKVCCADLLRAFQTLCCADIPGRSKHLRMWQVHNPRRVKLRYHGIPMSPCCVWPIIQEYPTPSKVRSAKYFIHQSNNGTSNNKFLNFGRGLIIFRSVLRHCGLPSPLHSRNAFQLQIYYRDFC